MNYAVSASACSPTCENPNAAQTCSLPDTENCVCSSSDMVVKDGDCVPASQCGCTYNGRHFDVRLTHSVPENIHWLTDTGFRIIKIP